MLQRSACSSNQNLVRVPGDNGGGVLPIVPRTLLEPTSDTPLSRLVNLPLSWRVARIQPVLMRHELLLFCAPAVQLRCLQQSRGADAPNNQPNEACTPCIAQPGIVHKMQYPLCIAPSILLSRTFRLR